MSHGALADIILTLHFLIAAFVVGGLVLTVVGGFRGWRWIRNYRFRIVHLTAIAIVVLETWFGVICPLTSLEIELRRQAQEATYSGSFIEYWLSRILYYDLPPWIFVIGYTIFGSLVVATWWWVPPDRNKR